LQVEITSGCSFPVQLLQKIGPRLSPLDNNAYKEGFKMQSAVVRGIRGAVDVSANTAPKILKATKELLQTMQQKNSLEKETIAAVIFSMTRDLNAVFPAQAARQLGWGDVPLFCTVEIDVPGALPRCIRILMLVNSVKELQEIKHVYLGGTVALRKDLAGEGTGN
jgi:chorismate mutase